MKKRRSTGENTVRSDPRRGFTIVEILVVVAIIVLLIGLVVPALRGVKLAGRRTVESSAARQLMYAYTNYANHYNDRVMPGYYDDEKAAVRNAAGQRIGIEVLQQNILAEHARARYPWRLAPFLSYNFRGLYVNEQQDVLDRYQQEDPDFYHYLVSLFPSLGLNTVWMGGDDKEGAFDPVNLAYYGRHHAVTLTELRDPQRQLVFASARGGDAFDPGEIYEGHHRIRSPYVKENNGYTWSEEYHPANPPDDFGFLSLRYDDEAVVAFADGHVNLLGTDALKDMRHWVNKADREDWSVPEPVGAATAAAGSSAP